MEGSHGINKKADLYASRRIKEVRENLGLKQSELGPRIGMKVGALSALEVGRSRTTIGKLAEIAKVAGVPLSTFLLPDDDPCFDDVEGKDSDQSERRYTV